MSLGFAGALVPSQKTGDLALCGKICTLPGEDGDISAPFSPDGGLLAISIKSATRTRARYKVVTSLTVDSAVTELNGRQILAKESGAQVVEMEGYWLARVATKHEVPFLAARIVLDEIKDVVPAPSGLVRDDGSVYPVGVANHLIRHPGDLLTFLRLAKAMRTASGRLKLFTKELLTTWSKEGSELA